jgi:hypothetical protein
MDVDGRNARHLLTDNTFFRWYWSPDGRYVAILNGVESATRLLIAHTDGSALHELSGLDTFHGLSWQADGQLAYVGRRAGHWLIGSADPISGAHHTIVQLPRAVRLKPDLFAVSCRWRGCGALSRTASLRSAARWRAAAAAARSGERFSVVA